MKSLTLHTHGCLTASLRDCASSSSSIPFALVAVFYLIVTTDMASLTVNDLQWMG